MRSSKLSGSRAALTLVAGMLAVVVAGCTSNVSPAAKTVVKTVVPTGSSTSAPVSSSSAAPSTTAPLTELIHIKLLNADGSTYGVGMPIIAFFSKHIASGKALQAATTATADGKPIKGAWYFEFSSYLKGYPIEGHWRPGPQLYWPAHAQIKVNIPAKGVSAGGGMAFDDSLTSEWATGARNISMVNDATKKMDVTSDGKSYGTFPVSLGASDTPTARGIKVIMDKGRVVRMHGPGYNECCVKYTQRLTYGGEYLHSAPWNCTVAPGCSGPRNNIGSADSSNGCTNLRPTDAQKLYGFLRVGDVVDYPNANGPAMSLGDGYGDWNVSWSEWQTGGLVSTLA